MIEEPRVALIDDDPLWLDTLADFLERRGYQTVSASAGGAGLDLLKKEPVKLALVDYHMPDMNGLELLTRLQESLQAPPVLLVSSDSEPTLARRALAAGAKAFLPKSSPPLMLLNTIKRLLLDSRIFLPVPRREGENLPVIWTKITFTFRQLPPEDLDN